MKMMGGVRVRTPEFRRFSSAQHSVSDERTELSMVTGHHTRRVISIAHSYAVALNRRLAHEMARAGGDEWEITAVAPTFMQGDLRPIALEPYLGPGPEPCA